MGVKVLRADNRHRSVSFLRTEAVNGGLSTLSEGDSADYNITGRKIDTVGGLDGRRVSAERRQTHLWESEPQASRLAKDKKTAHEVRRVWGVSRSDAAVPSGTGAARPPLAAGQVKRRRGGLAKAP